MGGGRKHEATRGGQNHHRGDLGTQTGGLLDSVSPFFPLFVQFVPRYITNLTPEMQRSTAERLMLARNRRGSERRRRRRRRWRRDGFSAARGEVGSRGEVGARGPDGYGGKDARDAWA